MENLRDKSDLVKEKDIILNRKERNRNIKDKSTGDFQEIEIELTFDGENKIEFLHLEKIIQNQNREIDRDNIQMYINGIKYPFRNYHSFYDYKNTVRILINKNIKIISFSNMFYDCERITKITFKNIQKPSDNSLSYMFQNCEDLVEIVGLENINTSNITYMDSMFSRCKRLKTINLPLQTENVTYMSRMFSGCKSLIEISGLERLNTSNLVYASYMFEDCCSLMTIKGLSNINLSKVREINGLFKGCSHLISVKGVENWDTSNVESIESLFEGCIFLKNLRPIRNWNMKSVTDISNAFRQMTKISEIDLNWNVSKVKNMQYCFENCHCLEKIKGLETFEVSNAKNLSGLFKCCYKLEALPGIKFWNTKKAKDMSEMFYGCRALKELNLSNLFRTNNVYNMSKMFYDCHKLQKIESHFNFPTSFPAKICTKIVWS